MARGAHSPLLSGEFHVKFKEAHPILRTADGAFNMIQGGFERILVECFIIGSRRMIAMRRSQISTPLRVTAVSQTLSHPDFIGPI